MVCGAGAGATGACGTKKGMVWVTVDDCDVISSACSTSLRGAGLLGTLSSDEYRAGTTLVIRVACASFSFELFWGGGASWRSGNNNGTCHAIVGCISLCDLDSTRISPPLSSSSSSESFLFLVAADNK